MASSRFEDIRITGITTCVPGGARPVEQDSSISAENAARISASTGVRRRHVVTNDVCASDLCAVAAEHLFSETGWERDSVEALIFVSQTPDYVLPATACSLHGRLRLPRTCVAFDVNLGCSGYVYGLWLAAGMIHAGLKRVVLLAGDTISRIVSPADTSVSMLFGDAGSATAIEKHPGAGPWHFELGSDGAGSLNLIVPAGGFRNPSDTKTSTRTEREGGNFRSDEDLFMDGGEIFAFTLNTVPRLCRTVMSAAGWTTDDVAGFVMHQANRFMLRHLGKHMKIPDDKLVIALEEFGNTSSASIPLAMSSAMRNTLTSPANVILAGFGVGFSWAAAAMTLGPMTLQPAWVLPTEERDANPEPVDHPIKEHLT